VVAEINCGCGSCEFCRRGAANHCPNRTVIGIAGRDGAMAERIAVPPASLHALDENISNDQAAFVEPLAAAMRIAQQVDLTAAGVVVLGDGRLGQLIARAVRDIAADVLLVGKHPHKLQLARDRDIETALLDEYLPDRSADVVIDATGRPEGFQLAARSVRPLGTIVLKSTFAADGGMNLAPIVIDEVSVVGSRCGPFDAAIEALASGRVEVTDLISRRFELAHGVEALEAAGDSRNIKVLIDVEQ